jgi:hypothetical protein
LPSFQIAVKPKQSEFHFPGARRLGKQLVKLVRRGNRGLVDGQEDVTGEESGFLCRGAGQHLLDQVTHLTDNPYDGLRPIRRWGGRPKEENQNQYCGDGQQPEILLHDESSHTQM